jgi:DNA adenine methylase
MTAGLRQSVIKWSGSKRLVAPALSALWPTVPEGARYFEPFVGGGSMLAVRPSRMGVAGDVIPELVALWVALRDRPAAVCDHYEGLWHRRAAEGPGVFTEVRSRFNRDRDPLDLLFLSRTCVNGLIRFNARGEFNNSLHHTRPGLHPDSLRRVVAAWSGAIAGLSFHSGDYRETLATARPGDLAFLDPPYVGTKGRYRPDPFDFAALWSELDRLNGLGVRWMLTLDGEAGDRHYTSAVPESLYRHRTGIGTGHSPFTRLAGASLDPVVESVYLNYVP